jgi:hypothetical protein
MEGSSYIERLDDTLSRVRPETAATIGLWCRRGYVSHQKAIEFVELLEADRRSTDEEMRGMERPSWYKEYEVIDVVDAENMDRVFYPGEIGGVQAQPRVVKLSE